MKAITVSAVIANFKSLPMKNTILLYLVSLACSTLAQSVYYTTEYYHLAKDSSKLELNRLVANEYFNGRQPSFNKTLLNYNPLTVGMYFPWSRFFRDITDVREQFRGDFDQPDITLLRDTFEGDNYDQKFKLSYSGDSLFVRALQFDYDPSLTSDSLIIMRSSKIDDFYDPDDNEVKRYSYDSLTNEFVLQIDENTCEQFCESTVITDNDTLFISLDTTGFTTINGKRHYSFYEHKIEKNKFGYIKSVQDTYMKCVDENCTSYERADSTIEVVEYNAKGNLTNYQFYTTIRNEKNEPIFHKVEEIDITRVDGGDITKVVQKLDSSMLDFIYIKSLERHIYIVENYSLSYELNQFGDSILIDSIVSYFGLPEGVVLNIEEEKQITIQTNIFPNPSTGIVNIQVENNMPFTAEVFDIQGRDIRKEKGIGELQLSNLEKGSYIIKLITSQGVSTQRIEVIE